MLRTIVISQTSAPRGMSLEGSWLGERSLTPGGPVCEGIYKGLGTHREACNLTLRPHLCTLLDISMGRPMFLGQSCWGQSIHRGKWLWGL